MTSARFQPTLAHEVMIVSLDPENGARRERQRTGFALAGALIGDLAMAGRIDLSGKRVVVTDPTPTGAALPDELLAAMVADKERTAQKWVEKWHGKVTDRVLQDLADAEIVQPRKEKVIGFIPTTRYPMITSHRRDAIIAAVRDSVLGQTPLVSPRAVVLASLLLQIRRRDDLFPELSNREAKSLVEKASRSDAVSEAVRKAIEASEAAGASVAMSGGG